MTDQELLTLAARAAAKLSSNDLCWLDNTPYFKWNPLDDDGAAMRLMVTLRISLEQDASVETYSFTYRGVTTGEYALGVEAWSVTETGRVVQWQEAYSDDAHAATRRAIVRVAAQLAEN